MNETVNENLDRFYGEGTSCTTKAPKKDLMTFYPEPFFALNAIVKGFTKDKDYEILLREDNIFKVIDDNGVERRIDSKYFIPAKIVLSGEFFDTDSVFSCNDIRANVDAEKTWNEFLGCYTAAQPLNELHKLSGTKSETQETQETQ